MHLASLPRSRVEKYLYSYFMPIVEFELVLTCSGYSQWVQGREIETLLEGKIYIGLVVICQKS